MIPYKLTRLAHIIKGQIFGNKFATINEIVTDSRRVTLPEKSLFVALQGPHQDGHNYIQDLYKQGVRHFLVKDLPKEAAFQKEATYLTCTDTLQALQEIAKYHRTSFNCPVIGITGSNGKTMVKEWLFQLIQADHVVTRSPKSYNSQTGVPLSTLLLQPETTFGIFEAGISLPGEMEALANIIQPTMGIFTNIGEAHQENFTSLEEKVKEKLKLFKSCPTLIYCKDHTLIDSSISSSPEMKGKHLVTWGRNPEATLHLEKVESQGTGTRITVTKDNHSHTLFIPFRDKASLEDTLHCLTLMLEMGYDFQTISTRMEQLEPIAMRLELKEGTNGSTLINDTYNSDLGSLPIALDFLDLQANTKNLSKTVILSDLFQTGQDPETLYSSIAEMMNHHKVSRFIGIGPKLATCSKAFPMESFFYTTTEDLLKSELLEKLENEVILVKGSRMFHFESITHKLELKTHETILEINLNAIVNNFNTFKGLLKPETKIVAMVKAFGYGSGSYEIGRVLQFHRCDYLAVAVVDEGIELRNAGISMPIMVMNPERNSYQAIIDFQLEPEIYSFSMLREFGRVAKRNGLKNYPIHLKIDTGMHRLGFQPQDIPPLIGILKSQNDLLVRSVFSHLVGSDETMHDYFTLKQIEQFDNASQQLQKAFDHHIIRHILNSAGIERFPQFQFDMVRLGIGLYGVSALPNTPLQPVGTLKSQISQIHEVPTGETIGYGRRGKVFRDSHIAIVPIGYADGYDRRLGNGVGKMSVNSHLAPVIGNICMDMTMIDVTGIPCHEGDNVIIFGENPTISELAYWMDTIPYEVITNISRRVKRVYYSE